ncbi:MAG: hypothetical protein H6706_00925 [Myxococcales bacterium]|nr:hypothetical protein [Myxococcales bacterium]
MSDAEHKNLLGRYRHLLRVVIELAAPLSIGTGDDTLDAANAVARDANDLPTIPGTSLAGVLRAAWGGEADALFGYQRPKVRTGRNDEEPADAQRSRLRVSWGSVHGQDDRPAQGLVPPATVEADPVLAAARGVVRRDHVRLNHRGVADGRGKHDRASVMAGHRFSFELEVMSDDPADDTLAKVVALLDEPAVRLGGRTRGGLGAFRVVRHGLRSYDLRDRVDLDAYIARPMRLAEVPLGMAMAPGKGSGGAPEGVTLALEAVEPWQIGGGDGDGLEAGQSDLLPYTERRVVWSDGRGAVGEPELVLPASAIKGALRHRTAFYLRAADSKLHAHTHPTQDPTQDPKADLDWFGPEALPGIALLFGEIKESAKGTAEARGRPGCVLIEDVRIPVSAVNVSTATHVALDRFTGGPLAGHLYQETRVGDVKLEVTLVVGEPAGRKLKGGEAEAFAQARAALDRAIDDLLEERLNLGAGADRGYGYFKGERR